ncbi:MAG: hypothetical protein MR732_06075, partial [Alistipes sp.]|nr:hypothetical protein [Alistipes sp.]
VLLTDVLLFAFPVDRGNLFSCHHKISIFCKSSEDLSPLQYAFRRMLTAMSGSDLTLTGGTFRQHDQHLNLKSYKIRSGRKGIERRQLKNMLKNSRSYTILFQHIHSPTAFKSHLG